MKLTEAEMRMVFQIESTNQNAALNEIWRIRKRGTSKSAIMRRCFPAISTMTIKTVRGSRPQNVSKSAENLLFLPLWLAFWTGRGCFPMREATEAYRRINHSKSTLFIFTERRCEDGCFSY